MAGNGDLLPAVVIASISDICLTVSKYDSIMIA
jgi:hypothetical protein